MSRVPAEVATWNLPPLHRPHFGEFLPKVKSRVERLGLIQEAIDQFLSPADRQRGNIVDRLVRIQFGALTASLRQRIDDVRADSEKSEFENLKQSHGTSADDDCLDRRGCDLCRRGFFRHGKPGSSSFTSKQGRKL